MSTSQSYPRVTRLVRAKQARQHMLAILAEIDAITETVEEWDARVEREEREKEVDTSGSGLNHYYHSTRKMAARRERWDWKPAQWVLEEVEVKRKQEKR